MSDDAYKEAFAAATAALRAAPSAVAVVALVIFPKGGMADFTAGQIDTNVQVASASIAQPITRAQCMDLLRTCAGLKDH